MASAPVTLNQTKPSYISAINADGVGSQGPVAIKKHLVFQTFNTLANSARKASLKTLFRWKEKLGTDWRM